MSNFRELVEKATPGPWEHVGSFAIKAVDRGGMRVGMFPSVGQAYRTSDAALIVALRNIAPALVEWYEADEDQRDSAETDLIHAIWREMGR